MKIFEVRGILIDTEENVAFGYWVSRSEIFGQGFQANWSVREDGGIAIYIIGNLKMATFWGVNYF